MDAEGQFCIGMVFQLFADQLTHQFAVFRNHQLDQLAVHQCADLIFCIANNLCSFLAHGFQGEPVVITEGDAADPQAADVFVNGGSKGFFCHGAEGTCRQYLLHNNDESTTVFFKIGPQQRYLIQIRAGAGACSHMEMMDLFTHTGTQEERNIFMQECLEGILFLSGQDAL